MALPGLAVLFISLAVLAKSSSIVIESSVKLSRFFRINQLAMGFILLAVATSLPELSVSIASASAGEGALAAGNVFGSNIANILIILGVGAFLYGMRISPQNLRDIGLILLLTTIISAYVIYNSYTGARSFNMPEGIALLAIFAIYVWWTLKSRKKREDAAKAGISKEKALKAFLLFVFGIIVVMVSSGFVVDSAIALTGMLGLAQSFIGATIIAVGTSLPELSTALQALRKRHYGLVLGNAIGSNMANITLVLGTASVLSPIEVHLPVFIAALLFAIVANSILFYAAAVNKGLRRFGGVLFLAMYAVYLIAIFGLQVSELQA